MARQDFNVVIMHGHAPEYLKVKKLVEKLGFTSIILKERWSGELILEKIRSTVWEKAHCAVIIMSPDDEAKDKVFRARQNVIFELGYCLGAFDSIPEDYWYNAVIVVKEKSVEKFADIGGLEYISYTEKILAKDLGFLSQALEDTYQNASNYYNEL